MYAFLNPFKVLRRCKYKAEPLMDDIQSGSFIIVSRVLNGVAFFCSSAVRPNNPVANEQNVNASSPSSAKQKRQSPERTTAILPARIAVLIQAKKQHRSNKANTTKNAKNGESRSRWLKLYNMKTNKISHTAINKPVLTLGVCPSPVGSLGLRYHVKTQEAVSSVFSQLGLEPNHTGLTA